MFQVTDTRGYLVLGHDTAQQIGYIDLPRIIPPKLTQPLKTDVHLMVITVKALSMGQDLRHPNIQLLDGAVLINGNTSYPLPKNTY